jgi:hypothetical protein
MAQLNTTQDILQYARAQSGITQQDMVGGSLYCEMIDADQAEWFRKDLQEKVSHGHRSQRCMHWARV